MDFLSEQLVSSEYRDRLNSDLRSADMCRFLVAYISEDGLDAIGRPDLVRALGHNERISKHPLHDTFIGEEAEERRDEFYEKSKRGALVAEIDQPRTVPSASKRQKKLIPESIARVQRVFTMKLDSLQSEWASIAKHLKASKHERDHR